MAVVVVTVEARLSSGIARTVVSWPISVVLHPAACSPPWGWLASTRSRHTHARGSGAATDLYVLPDLFPQDDGRGARQAGGGAEGGGGRRVQAFGLAVLMVKAGLPVPAAQPVRMPYFSSVLADIGDEQSLSASLSTFSGHLRRIQVLSLPPSCRIAESLS